MKFKPVELTRDRRATKSLQGHSTKFDSLRGSQTVTPGNYFEDAKVPTGDQTLDQDTIQGVYYNGGYNDLIKVQDHLKLRAPNSQLKMRPFVRDLQNNQRHLTNRTTDLIGVAEQDDTRCFTINYVKDIGQDTIMSKDESNKGSSQLIDCSLYKPRSPLLQKLWPLKNAVKIEFADGKVV